MDLSHSLPEFLDLSHFSALDHFSDAFVRVVHSIGSEDSRSGPPPPAFGSFFADVIRGLKGHPQAKNVAGGMSWPFGVFKRRRGSSFFATFLAGAIGRE